MDPPGPKSTSGEAGELNPSTSNRPYDEMEDSVDVRKALELLALNTEKDPQKLFNVRSSLRNLHLPFITIADEEDDTRSSFTIKEEATKDGCYLIYDYASGGTLVLHYSHDEVPENAIGFWAPGEGKKIQNFKFQDAGGYSELIRGIIGGERNKKKYLSGWCQFIQLAKALSGKVKKVPNPTQGVKVDIYGFIENGSRVKFLDLDDKLVDVSDIDAVAVVYHENDRFEGVHTLTETAFLELGSLEGASLKLHD